MSYREEKMELQIIVDNLCSKSGMLAEWGFSAWLTDSESNQNILLDTGGPLHALEHNLKFLQKDPALLNAIILSHSHYDHVGGIDFLRNHATGARFISSEYVYQEKRGDANQKRVNGGLPDGYHAFLETFKEEFPVTANVTAFCVPQDQRDPMFYCQTNLWQVEDDGSICCDKFRDDVSLLVKSKNGYSVILGCAHTGLPNILKYVKNHFGIICFDTIVGGTHLCAVKPSEYAAWVKELSQYSVKHWRLSHCTGFKAAATLFGAFDDVDWAGAGTVISLG